MKNFRKFYNKTKNERIDILQKVGKITEEQTILLKENNLTLGDTANHLIENQISNYEIPYGIATGFLINNKEYVIPMATEEPSVIAAATFGATLISKNGGFTAKMEEKYLIGEIVLEKYNKEKIDNILKNKEKLIEISYEIYPSILKYGGGIKDINVEEKEKFLIIYITLDTGEAMGANMMNTILEGLSPYICELVDGTTLMSILSNYAEKSIVTSKFKISTKLLTTENFNGEYVRDRIILASELANCDIYRATTHNKGVMNGINAVVIATGNDWRAVEASIHSYASKNGSYSSITKFYRENDDLVGEINIPLAIGNVGGSIKIHPMAKLTHQIIGHNNVKELAEIIASVGLAQNFAALRALVTSGIQKGHMKLHRKSLAIVAGANENDIPKILELLKNEKTINLETVKNIIKNIRK